MDLLRRTHWLRVLTVLLVGLGSTAVAAQPHGPAAEVSAGASSDGTASEAGFSLVATSNAVGLVDAAVPGTEPAVGAASSSPALSVQSARAAGDVLQASLVLPAERPLRHRLCVYRL